MFQARNTRTCVWTSNSPSRTKESASLAGTTAIASFSGRERFAAETKEGEDLAQVRQSAGAAQPSKCSDDLSLRKGHPSWKFRLASFVT